MIDLHYWPTPNGKKVTILLEELGMPYKIVPVNIGRGDQFTPEFLEMNPNHRMPVMVDHCAAGRRQAARRVRIGRDHDVSRREGREVLSAGPARQGRGQRVADLADGQPGTEERRVRPFPPAVDSQGRRPDLRHHPLHRRGEPPVRRAQQPALQAQVSRRRPVHDRRHDLLPVDRQLEVPGPGHRGVQALQALVRGDGRAARRPEGHGGRRRSLGRPRASCRPRSRPASARCSTTSAPGRSRRRVHSLGWRFPPVARLRRASGRPCRAPGRWRTSRAGDSTTQIGP